MTTPAENAEPLRFPAAAIYLWYAFVASMAFMKPSLRIAGNYVQFSELIFLAFAAVAAAYIIYMRLLPRLGGLWLPLVVYLGASAISASFSPRASTSLVKLAGVAYLAAIAAAAVAVIRDVKILKSTVIAFIAGSTFAALAASAGALLFYIAPDLAAASGLLHHYGSLPPGNYPRVEGTFIYPAMLCNYLTVGMMLTLAAGKIGWIGKRIAAAIVAVHVIAAIFTVTPGLGVFVLAGAAWIAYLLWEKRPWTARLTAFGGILIAAASVLVSALSLRQIPTSPYRFELWGTTIDPTQRLLTWQGSFATFAAHPLVGKGLGLPATAVEFLAPSGGRQMLTDAHNTFLNIAATTGVLGLAAVLLLCVITIAAARRALASNYPPADSAGPETVVHMSQDTETAGGADYPTSDPPATKPVSLAPLPAALLIAFISGFIVQGLTGSFEDARHLWLTIGLIWGCSELNTNAPSAWVHRALRHPLFPRLERRHPCLHECEACIVKDIAVA